jgi:hypothetical protein
MLFPCFEQVATRVKSVRKIALASLGVPIATFRANTSRKIILIPDELFGGTTKLGLIFFYFTSKLNTVK